MNTCPNRDELLRLLESGATPEATAGYDQHFVECETCRLLLEQLADSPLNNLPVFQRREERTSGLPPLDLKIPGYELLGEVARGSTAVVYRARQIALGRLVALKVVRPGACGTSEQRERFLREARAIAQLKHTHIVQVHDIGVAGDLPFLALELMEGSTLQQVLTATLLSARDAALLLEALAGAVAAAHRGGVVHRDLKPANVLLGRAESGNGGAIFGGWLPKLADFGTAKALNEAHGLTRDGEILGTPAYMAPEQATPGSSVTTATDVYGLGAILYECLTGRPPYRGETDRQTLQMLLTQEAVPIRRLNPSVPRDLETTCMKCLEKEPGRRYVSAQAFADDLRCFLDGRPIKARPVGAVERTWRWCRRRPAVASLMAALSLCISISLGLLLSLWLQAQAGEEQALAGLHREEKARRQAEELFTEVLKATAELVELGHSPDLQNPAAQRERFIKILGKAETHYQNLLRQRGDDVRAQRSLAEVYLSLGKLQRDSGKLDEALSTFQRAQKLLKGLNLENTGDMDHRDGLARAHEWLGVLHTEKKDYAQSLRGCSKRPDFLRQQHGKEILPHRPHGRAMGCP